MLRCYDSLHTILMGEVYGYFAHTPGGSSYVTGGGRSVNNTHMPLRMQTYTYAHTQYDIK